MWIERRMTSGPGQTKAGAASCPLDAIGEDRPGPWCATVVSTGGRAGRRFIEPLRGITSIPARMSSATRTQRESPDQDERAVGEQRLNEPKPVAPRPSDGRRRPSCGSSRSIPHDDRFPAGLRPRTGGGTPRAIARIEVRAIGSAMWLVRCCCRRGPLRIPAPALVESRPSRSLEPVSGGSCHLRSGVLARPNRSAKYECRCRSGRTLTLLRHDLKWKT